MFGIFHVGISLSSAVVHSICELGVLSPIPMVIAATRKNLHALKMLMSQPDCDVNVRSCKGLTALHVAAHGGLVDNVNELLSHPHIDCNAMDNNGAMDAASRK